MMFKIYCSIIFSEIVRIFTTYSVLSIMILGPFVYFFLYPQPYNNEVIRNIPIGVINQDNTNESRALIRELNATDAIKVTEYFNSVQDAQNALEKHKIYGLVLIPFDYEKNLLAGRQSPIAFYGDASYTLIYGTLATALSKTIANVGANISINNQIAQGVDPTVAKNSIQPFLAVTSVLFNPEIGYATFVIPPVFILILHQMLLVGVSLVNISAHNTTSEQKIIRSYPHPNRLTFLLIFGKLSVYFFLYSFFFWFFVLFSAYWYQLPRLGHFIPLFYLSCIFITLVSFLGIALSFLLKKMENILLTIIPISIVLFFLTGLSWPYQLMPDIYENAANFVPAIPLMLAFVKINAMGGDWSNAQSELFILFVQIIVFIPISFYLMNRYVKKTLSSKEINTYIHYDE